MGKMRPETSIALSTVLFLLLILITATPHTVSALDPEDRVPNSALGPANMPGLGFLAPLTNSRSSNAVTTSTEFLLLAVEGSARRKTAGTENDPIEDDDEIDLIGRKVLAPNTAGARIELVRIAGELSTDSADTFLLILDEPRTLRIKTAGATDTVGALLDCHARPLAVNDDGGEGMNFSIASALSPGCYTVRVAGYRGASGSYSLIVEILNR